MRFGIWPVSILILTSTIGHSANAGSTIVWKPYHVNHTSSSDSVVVGIIVNSTPVLLDSSATLSNVQALFDVSVHMTPQRRQEIWSVCYIARDSTGPYFIDLQSDDMGGPDHQLLGFDITKTSHLSKGERVRRKQCTFVSKRPLSIRTSNGLYLGMSLHNLLRIMGTPKRINGRTYYFEYDHVYAAVDMRGVKRPEYEIFASLTVEIIKGHVVRLKAWYGDAT